MMVQGLVPLLGGGTAADGVAVGVGGGAGPADSIGDGDGGVAGDSDGATAVGDVVILFI